MNQQRNIKQSNRELQDADLQQIIGDSRGVERFNLCTHLNNIDYNNISWRGVEGLAGH